MKFSIDDLDLNIRQYTSATFEGNRPMILTILQKIFVLLAEEWYGMQITKTLYYNSLQKLLKFIEENDLQDSERLYFSEIRGEMNKLTAPIARETA